MPLAFPAQNKQTNKTFKRLKKKICHDINHEVVKLFHCFNAGSCFFSLSAEWGDGRGFVYVIAEYLGAGERIGFFGGVSGGSSKSFCC